MKGRPEGPPSFRLSGALGRLSMPVFDRQENNIGRKHCSEIPRQLHEHSQVGRKGLPRHAGSDTAELGAVGPDRHV